MKAILFDADGVLTLPEELFSVVYARSHGLDIEPFQNFFKSEWQDFVVGKRDLLEHIQSNPGLWQWEGTPEELLKYWFKSEDIRNEEMIELIRQIRGAGTPCFLATEQEKHRGSYMKETMFKDLFDGYFVTADLGLKKSDPQFFLKIVEQLKNDGLNLQPEDVLFFDDSQSKVDAAKQAGLDAHLFTGISKVKEVLQV